MGMNDLPLAKVPWAALDFEGAGEMAGFSDVPIQIGVAAAVGCAGPVPEHCYRSFIAANRPVALAARQVHGISEKDLVGAPEMLALWPTLKEQLGGRVLVAHNASVERRYLRAFPGHGLGPWVDTLPLARQFFPQLESHRLGDLVEALHLKAKLNALCPGLRWHDALYDAAASLLLLQHMIESAELQEKPLRLLLR